jgi:hypothetical protein
MTARASMIAAHLLKSICACSFGVVHSTLQSKRAASATDYVIRRGEARLGRWPRALDMALWALVALALWALDARFRVTARLDPGQPYSARAPISSPLMKWGLAQRRAAG